MAAILCPAPHHEPHHEPHGTPRPATPARPELRVVPGGGSRPEPASVYRRRRVVALVLAAGVLVAAVQGFDVATDAAARWVAPEPVSIAGPTVVVEARAGDTLWSIARRVHPGSDVRPVVEAMLSERGGAEVQVGDRVRVPSG